MCNDEEIILTDKEEELAIENNPIIKKFKQVKADNNSIICMVEVLLTALNNEFDDLSKDDIIEYCYILKNHLKDHEKLLFEFIREINIPDKSKVLHLAFSKFRD